MCNNPALNHTISELQKLSKESLNSEGMNVTNKYDNHGYDALEIGCKSSLSEHACHVADVDKDVLPKQKKSGSAFGTFVLVLFILGEYSPRCNAIKLPLISTNRGTCGRWLLCVQKEIRARRTTESILKFKLIILTPTPLSHKPFQYRLD